MSKWPEVPLVQVARLSRGTEPGSASYTDSSRGVRFLRVGDVTGINDNPMFTNSQEVVLVGENDILLTLDGSPGYVSTGHKGAISSGIRRVEPIDPDKVRKEWLKYSLMSPSVQETIRRYTTGVTILHASSAIPQIRIPLPPAADQDRIVRMLDKGDALRRLRATASHRTAAIAQALFGELIGLGMPWRMSQLEALCTNIVDCPHSTPTYAVEKTPFPCVRSSDIQNGHFDWSTTKYVEESEYRARIKRIMPRFGDVVYCREGARLGNAAIVPKNVSICLGQRMMLFRVDPLVATAEFIWALLHSRFVRGQVISSTGGAASPHINIRDIRLFAVPVPPLKLQETFSTQVSQVRVLETAQAGSRQRLDDLFRSLLHSAWQGEL